MDGSRYSPTEAAAKLLYLLIVRRRLTTREAARLVGYTPSGVYRLLCRISRVVPLVFLDGEWQLLSDAEEDI